MKSKNLKNKLGKILALFLMAIMVVSYIPVIFGNPGGIVDDAVWTGWPLVEGVTVTAYQGGYGQQRFTTTHYILTIGPGGPVRETRAAANAPADAWANP